MHGISWRYHGIYHQPCQSSGRPAQKSFGIWWSRRHGSFGEMALSTQDFRRNPTYLDKPYEPNTLAIWPTFIVCSNWMLTFNGYLYLIQVYKDLWSGASAWFCWTFHRKWWMSHVWLPIAWGDVRDVPSFHCTRSVRLTKWPRESDGARVVWPDSRSPRPRTSRGSRQRPSPWRIRMYAILMVTFTINIPQMLAYMPYDWILWVAGKLARRLGLDSWIWTWSQGLSWPQETPWKECCR